MNHQKPSEPQMQPPVHVPETHGPITAQNNKDRKHYDQQTTAYIRETLDFANLGEAHLFTNKVNIVAVAFLIMVSHEPMLLPGNN